MSGAFDPVSSFVFQPETGEVAVHGTRMLLVSQQCLRVMSRLLADQLGAEQARAFVSQLGYQSGQDDYRLAAAQLTTADADHAGRDSCYVERMWSGMARVEVTTAAIDHAAGRLELAGRWVHSFEAENHLASHGRSSEPVCAWLAAYTSGWVSASYGAPAVAVERTCRAQGHAHCAFEVRPDAAWGPEADPWRRALAPAGMSVSEALERRVVVRTSELVELRGALDEHALVSITDPRGKIIFANDRFCQVSKYRRDELLGQDHRILNSGTHSKAFMADLWQTIQAGRVWRGEVCNRDKSGAEYWVETTITPLMGADGRPRQYISLRTDISKQKRTEAEIKVAKEAAERANQAKSAFLAMMSHEIRTPLNGVLGFAGLLAESTLDEDQRHSVSLIQSSGEGLLAVINDILDFTKIEADQLTTESIPYDFWAVLDGVMQFMGPRAAGQSVEMRLQRASDVPRWLLGDPWRVRQVLLNLVGNALKFTQDGRVTLLVDAADGMVTLTVEDTGIGMTPKQQGRLFQPFSQADGSTTRRFGGTGLGLAISKRLTEMMGGRIGVRSQPGQGSRFWFSVPATIPAPERVSAALPIGEPALVSGRQLRVLVAEDNAANQFLARRMLTGLGCAVDIVANGRDAIDRWSGVDYDIVFMDCHMPEMDGLAATREIRRQERQAGPSRAGRRPRSIIVAFTASALAEERAACLEAGMDDFVTKPVLKTEIIRCLNLCRVDAGPAAGTLGAA